MLSWRWGGAEMAPGFGVLGWSSEPKAGGTGSPPGTDAWALPAASRCPRGCQLCEGHCASCSVKQT